MPQRPRSRGALIASAVVSLAALGSMALRVGVDLGASAGVGVLIAELGLIAAVVVWSQRRADREFAREGELNVTAGLPFDCLPGQWPTAAQETMNPLTGGRVPVLPVRLRASGSMLILEKRLGPIVGRHPFVVKVRRSDITDIRVEGSSTALVGSSVALTLRTGEVLRCDLPVRRKRAERVAELIRRIPGDSAAVPPAEASAIHVESAPVPPRTNPARAGMLLMAPLPAWTAAMLGFSGAPLAWTAASITLLAALAMTLYRPVQMARRVGVLLWVTAAAFVGDALLAQQPLRLGGALLAAPAAWWLTRQPPTATPDA